MKQAGKREMVEADAAHAVTADLMRTIEKLGRETETLEQHSAGLEVECDQGRYDRDKALDALTREYHYHMLRADELADFLYDRGIIVRPE